jgi:hypothetical protein
MKGFGNVLIRHGHDEVGDAASTSGPFADCEIRRLRCVLALMAVLVGVQQEMAPLSGLTSQSQECDREEAAQRRIAHEQSSIRRGVVPRPDVDPDILMAIAGIFGLLAVIGFIVLSAGGVSGPAVVLEVVSLTVVVFAVDGIFRQS